MLYSQICNTPCSLLSIFAIHSALKLVSGHDIDATLYICSSYSHSRIFFQVSSGSPGFIENRYCFFVNFEYPPCN